MVTINLGTPGVGGVVDIAGRHGGSFANLTQMSVGSNGSVAMSVGAKLMTTPGLLYQFIAFPAQREAPFINAAPVLEWASKPQGVEQEWRARRPSEVRRFARFAHALDPSHEVPPQRLFPYRRQRPRPYIYSDV